MNEQQFHSLIRELSIIKKEVIDKLEEAPTRAEIIEINIQPSTDGKYYRDTDYCASVTVNDPLNEVDSYLFFIPENNLMTGGINDWDMWFSIPYVVGDDTEITVSILDKGGNILDEKTTTIYIETERNPNGP